MSSSTSDSLARSHEKEAILDPVRRVSEVIFGVLMALSITGSFSVATAGRHEVWLMLYAAVGCNIAWGLTDAVMYIVSMATERHRQVTLLRRLREVGDDEEAHRLIAGVLPEHLAANAGAEVLEALRRQLLAAEMPGIGIRAVDVAGAFAVFAIVVLATFPVVAPFMFISDAVLALRLSNVLALITLFVCGRVLGRYAGGRPWRYGLGMTAIGMFLVAVIIVLGG